MPIRLRPHRVRIPSRPLHARTAARQLRQQKLPLVRFEISIQMSRLDMSVGSQFIQRRGICRNAKPQQTRLIPHHNRLNERSSRKNAVPYRARPVASNFRAYRISNPSAKKYLVRRRSLCKRHDFLPNFFWRRANFDSALHFEHACLWPREMLDPKQSGRHQRQRREDR